MHVVRMAHPGRNALGSDLIAWLDAELDRAGSDPILLAGSQGAFCAGLNLKEVANSDAAAMERMLGALDRLVQRLFEHPAPTAAAVNGHAIAGGCALAQCCDFRVAGDDPAIRIGLNETALGACFPPRVLRVVRDRVPRAHHATVLLGAGLHAPAEARRLGLVDALAPDAEAAARAWLEGAARHPRATYAHTKALLRAGVAAADDADLRRFRERELPLWTSEELRARVRAVLAK